jgi:Putative Flp pilus-assembly TadE/G-like
MRSRPLSSITRPARGQTLVVFALSLVVMLSMAALAFDVGQVLISQRSQQNAADAAALGGARYIAATGCKANPSLSNPACAPAVAAALKVAQLNGYGDGTTNCINGCTNLSPTVTIKIPPGPEAVPYDSKAGAIEVQIGSRRGGIFSGVLGITNWTVGTMAVAANQVDTALSFSFLALDPTGCGSVKLTGAPGSGLIAGGNVQVNSTCNGGLQVGNNATLEVTSGACNVSGSGIAKNGHPTINCTVNTNMPAIPDPLAGMAAPMRPPLAAAPVNVDIPTAPPPANCPSVLSAPATCQFSASYAGTRWRLFPGTYPGGLKLLAGTFFLEPGIYYLAGGGLSAGGNGVVVESVDPGSTATGPDAGVLFYNTSDSDVTCTAFPGACGAGITLNGSGASVVLDPYLEDPYKGMVIFQDRTLNATLVLDGSSSGLNVTGTVYAPLATVQVNGSNSTATDLQIIAYDFVFNGSGGNMTVGYDAGSFLHIRGSGLVK